MRRSLLGDSLGGIRAVLAPRVLRRVLLLGWLVPAFSVAPESLAAPGVHELGGGGVAVGFWLASLPAGVIIGELASLWLISAERRPRAVVPLACWVFLPYVGVRRSSRASSSPWRCCSARASATATRSGSTR